MDFQENEEYKHELFTIFQAETEDLINNLYECLKELRVHTDDMDLINSSFRYLHSLKGSVRMIGFENIQRIVHTIEDIFDKLRSDAKYKLNEEIILHLEKSLDYIVKCLTTSIEKQREFIDGDYSSVLSDIENLTEINSEDITADEGADNDAINMLNDISEGKFDLSAINLESLIPQNFNNDKNDNGEGVCNNSNLWEMQETINGIFNHCFELVDDIVPEMEYQNTVILIEEVQQLYDIFANTNLYEIKTSLQNVLTKLEFVSKATNMFTISEILEIRNEISASAAKYTTCSVEDTNSKHTFFDIAEKIVLLQSGSVYAQEIKDDIEQLKPTIENNGLIDIINIIVDILDFVIDNSIQLEEQMLQTIKNSLEYCASPNENIDEYLIIQQLEILKQLLELSYKKDTEITEIKNLSTQSSTSNSAITSEIKTLHVSSQKLDTLINQLGELIVTKIRTEKNLDKIETIKTCNEICQKNLLKSFNYLRYYNRKYLQADEQNQYANTFTKQVFTLLSEITRNVSKTIYDLNSLHRASKEDDVKMRIIIDEMETMIKNIRVLPISTVFNSFSRMIRDIAFEKGKDIDFELIGKETCADKKIIEEIKTPLIHILRNAVDHGIETKEERLNAGKKPVGRIVLSAKQDNNSIIIDVIDDGKGFNLQKIREKAVSKGFLTQEEVNSMNDEAIMNVIFWPGFTTGDSITSISGRGVGLDVVKTKISQLNGKVKVVSEFGKGSCVHIEIPVTVTTLRVFVVKVSNQIFAIPIQMISTFILKSQDEIKTNNGNKSIIYEEKIVPLYYLSDILDLETTDRNKKEIILIIKSDEKTIALVVDQLLGDQDVLQKKLPAPLYKVKNISGVTNLSSGDICLILNMQDILHHNLEGLIAKSVLNQRNVIEKLDYRNILVIDDSNVVRSLIQNILRAQGYRTETVHSAEEALEKLKKNNYDLIITDVLMEKMSGIQLVEKLKTNEMYYDIPIIIISFEEEKKYKDVIKQYNIAAYISKNEFNQTEFLNKVNEILIKND